MTMVMPPQEKEGDDVSPMRPPNTKGAVASILVTVMVLVVFGVFLYLKFQRKEEMEALLAEIRRWGKGCACAYACMSAWWRCMSR